MRWHPLTIQYHSSGAYKALHQSDVLHVAATLDFFTSSWLSYKCRWDEGSVVL